MWYTYRMKTRHFVFVAAACAAWIAFGAPEKIIFDTDMYTDFDDVGALATLHALADAGECEILGTVASTRGTPAVGMVEIINAYYGRPDIPVGANRELGLGPLGRSHAIYDIYADMVKANKDVVKHPTSDAAPDANETYRRILAAQPDGSVTICSVGFTTNLRRLLETKGDAFSPLDGRALVAKKVKAWYAMACRYPDGYEYNSKEDGASSKIAFRDWPTPIYFLDWCYGVEVKCGVPVSKKRMPVNPVRDVFKRALTAYKETEKGHPAWDEVTVLAAVRGWERYFGTVRGRFDIVDAKGKNAWTPDPNGNHYVLTVKTPKAEVGAIVDELMARGSLPSVRNASALTEARTYASTNGATLGYRFHAPANLEQGRRYPLVLFLHGAGERGDDNVLQQVHGVWPILSYMKEKKIDGYLIAPQCPKGKRWVETPWDASSHKMPKGPSESMKLVLELLDKTLKECPVDERRVYVTGLSMGGYGTWDIVQRYPNLFAAAMPLCGGGDPALAHVMRDVPIWAFHGDCDKAVPVRRSRQMVSALWECDGNVRYREYPGVGHNCWDAAYSDAAVLDWFFSQRRK